MLSRTARAWCDVGDATKSESTFVAAADAWQRLEASQPNPDPEQLAERSSVRFFMLCWRAQTAWKRGNAEAALALALQAKTALAGVAQQKQDEAAALLVATCFDISLRLFNDRHFSEAASWLEAVVIELERDPKRSEKARRLLASCFAETNQHDKALALITAASPSAATSPASLLVLFRIHMAKGRADEAKSTAQRILQHTELTTGTGLALCRLAAESGNIELAKECFAHLAGAFASEPARYSEVVVRRVEFLLANSASDPEVLVQIDRVVSARALLTPEAAAELRRMLWNAGAAAFQAKDHAQTLDWLRRTLALFDSSGAGAAEEQAKCLRLIAFCHIQLGDARACLESAAKSLEIEGTSLCGLTLSVRARIALDDASGATRDIELLAAAQGVTQAHLEHCAQLALEAEKPDIAAKALEHVLAISRGDRLAVPTRSLLKLVLTNANSEPKPAEATKAQLARCSAYLTIAAEKLRVAGPTAFFGRGATEEASWFFAVAWNLARDAAGQHEFRAAHDLYLAACDFGAFVAKPLDGARMCMILAAAASLEMQPTGADVAREAISLIERAKQQAVADSVKPLVALIEFRAHALLGDTAALRRVLEGAATTGMPAGVFEAMADACSRTNPECAAESLRRCLAVPAETAERTARVTRKLIGLQKTRDEALPLYEEAAKKLEGGLGATWPVEEREWLAATCWNNGVFFYRLGDWRKAERWMSLSQVIDGNKGTRKSSEAARAYEEVLKRLHSQQNES